MRSRQSCICFSRIFEFLPNDLATSISNDSDSKSHVSWLSRSYPRRRTYKCVGDSASRSQTSDSSWPTIFLKQDHSVDLDVPVEAVKELQFSGNSNALFAAVQPSQSRETTDRILSIRCWRVRDGVSRSKTLIKDPVSFQYSLHVDLGILPE